MATLVSISGAMVVTLYKGPAIGSLLMQSISFSHMSTAKNNWIVGGLFLAIASLSVSIWNTFQAAILKGYPSELTIVAFYCLFGTIQCALVSLVAERDHPNAWKIGSGMELIAIIYSAVFGSVVTFWVQTWCIRKKGPVFVSMFKPLGVAIAALFGVIFLGDTLHLGSVIGVMWGQSIEDEQNAEMDADADAAAAADHERQLPTSSHNTPLLMQKHRATETVL